MGLFITYETCREYFNKPYFMNPLPVFRLNIFGLILTFGNKINFIGVERVPSKKASISLFITFQSIII